MKTCLEKVPALVLFCVSVLLTPAFASTVPKSLAQQKAKPHPAILVRHPAYNFGAVVQGATIEHAFTVSNTGKQTLKIEHVKVA